LDTRITNSKLVKERSGQANAKSLGSAGYKTLERVHGSNTAGGDTGNGAGSVQVRIAIDKTFGLEEETCSEHGCFVVDKKCDVLEFAVHRLEKSSSSEL
jgi:hypothetical protein